MLRRWNIKIVKRDFAVDLGCCFTKPPLRGRISDIELKDFDLFTTPELAPLGPPNAGNPAAPDPIKREPFEPGLITIRIDRWMEFFRQTMQTATIVIHPQRNGRAKIVNIEQPALDPIAD